MVITELADEVAALTTRLEEATVRMILAERRAAFFREWAGLVLEHNHQLLRRNSRLRERLRVREGADLVRSLASAQRFIAVNLISSGRVRGVA